MTAEATLKGGTMPSDFSVWSVSGHAPVIEYSSRVLDEIRALAVEGLLRLRRGGVEVGGVLFGSRDGDRVRLLDLRPLACEYAQGPSFLLSQNDEAALKTLIEKAQADPELSGLEPIGWYHSHTRTDVFLSDADVSIYDRYFPKVWQIALVLRPTQPGEAEVGFFFRDPDGKLRAESSYNPFTIHPLGKPLLLAPPQLAPPQEGLPVQLTRPQMSPLVPLVPDTLPEKRAKQRWPWLIASIVLASLGIGVLAQWVHISGLPSSRPPTLNLWASDEDGQVRIRWNRDAEPVMSAEKASLFIVDGDRKLETTLSRELLHNGSVLYQRKSPDLEIRLLVKGAVPVQEMTRLMGLSGPAAVPVGRLEAADAVPLMVARGPKVQPVEKPPHIPTLAVSVIPVVTPPRIPPPAPKATALYRGLVELFGDWLPFSVYRGPMTGRLLWTGTLAAGGDLRIDGDRASTGYITGRMPKAPIRLSVHPANFSRGSINVYTRELPAGKEIDEQPGPSNGWTRTVYKRNPARADDVLLIELPSAQNHWNRIAVRAGNRTVSGLVVDWEVISHEP